MALFQAQLREILNPEHPLFVLAERIAWQRFDEEINACYEMCTIVAKAGPTRRRVEVGRRL